MLSVVFDGHGLTYGHPSFVSLKLFEVCNSLSGESATLLQGLLLDAPRRTLMLLSLLRSA